MTEVGERDGSFAESGIEGQRTTGQGGRFHVNDRKRERWRR